MKKIRLLAILLLGITLLSQCRREPNTVQGQIFGTPAPLMVPDGFPSPTIPKDNPMTEEGIKLGRFLFYEKALSDNGTMSCGSCHIQERAFTDATPVSVGTLGIPGRRKSMPLFNLAFQEFFLWDGRASSLEEQSLHPILDSLELNNDLTTVIQRLNAIDRYPPLFYAAFGSSEITADKIAKAIAQFERSMISANSKFDRVIRLKTGEEFTEMEQRGYELFQAEFDPLGGSGGDCEHCHGELQTQYLFGAFGADLQFINNGSKMVYTDEGRAEVTGDPADVGKFKVPSLRNVQFSFPYMHDGSVPNLDSLIGFYNFGGHLHPNVNSNMKAAGKGRNWNRGQRQALAEFLRTLTDYDFLEDTAFSDPFK